MPESGQDRGMGLRNIQFPAARKSVALVFSVMGAGISFVIATGVPAAVENVRATIDAAGNQSYSWFTPSFVSKLWWLPVIACVLILVWGFRPQRRRNAPSAECSLPLSIGELSAPDYSRTAGLSVPVNGGALAPPLLAIRNVFISNTSLDRAVTLNIQLNCKYGDGERLALDSSGRGSFGQRLGLNDRATASMKRQNIEPTRYILSPVSIPPQTTIHGMIPFVISHLEDEDPTSEQFGWFVTRAVRSAGVEHFTYELEITDLITKTTVTVPLPSKGYP